MADSPHLSISLLPYFGHSLVNPGSCLPSTCKVPFRGKNGSGEETVGLRYLDATNPFLKDSRRSSALKGWPVYQPFARQRTRVSLSFGRFGFLQVIVAPNKNLIKRRM
jgi:hypothetical protein